MLSLQQFEKIAPTKIMPPWTLEELELARPYASIPVTKDALEARFLEWGGSVRYCLASATDFGRKRLAEAIQRVNVNRLGILLDTVGSTPVCYFPPPIEDAMRPSKRVPHAKECVFVVCARLHLPCKHIIRALLIYSNIGRVYACQQIINVSSQRLHCAFA